MDLGDTLPFRSDVYDGPFVAGQPSPNLVNASSVALTIYLPDGTTVTPTVTNPPAVTGKYRYDYTTSPTGPAGAYVGRWLFTFAGGATTAYKETFDVGGALVTVDEALAHLRAAGVIKTDVDLDYLQYLTFVATNAVELDLGRDYTQKTIVERHNGGCRSISLRRSPILSITSVVDNGSTITDYVPDDFGILWRSTYGWFAYGLQTVVVTYVVGSLNPPPVVRKVALNAIEGMWQASQQASMSMLADIAEQSVGAATTQLTGIERAAYESLRAVGVA